MIDIHCHILPGVDDGPEKTEESILMAKEAVKEGIKTIIATPHHRNNRYYNSKEEILKKVNKLNDELTEIDIPLTILPGQENRIFGELIEDYRKGEILTLNNSDYLFIEFPTSSVPRYAEQLLYDIQLEGLTPIIVHPERNKELLDNPTILYNFIKNGALSQVTAASLCGYFGKSIQKYSKLLIEHNLTHFIASDAHNLRNRSFKFSQAFEIIQKEYGSELFYFFVENAELLSKGKIIEKDIPVPIMRRKKFLGVF
ncbi:tyrosine-protein phosphatase [Niallia sp. MER 6]|uniref:tyrosine-protein phosphatase n=1 Tax=Niallia sp. MER 6 TaxID=2939567 RepID=UPI00203A54A4|nr:CpsB/CapC family capsule biosynthesis tyrosine phosphatase [Niallia sp. MER 6]MCM3033894.1 tyrosine protein phosphatase [Niallia sp. MER 6]